MTGAREEKPPVTAKRRLTGRPIDVDRIISVGRDRKSEPQEQMRKRGRIVSPVNTTPAAPRPAVPGTGIRSTTE